MAIDNEHKLLVEEKKRNGMSIDDIAVDLGYTWREVHNYLQGQGLTGGFQCEIPVNGVNKEWLLRYADTDIRKRNRALRKATGREIKEKHLARLYHQMCKADGSPEPYAASRGECEKCEKFGLCSMGYVRCESVQDWEGDMVEEIMGIVESDREVYEDCYPCTEEVA